MDTKTKLTVLAQSVVGRLTAAEKSQSKVDDHYLAIGLTLIEARARIDAGETLVFDSFTDFVEWGCYLGKSRAYEMIAIANGTKTLEEVREETGKRRDAARERQREASAPERTSANRPKTNGNSVGMVEIKRETRGRKKKPTTPEAALIKEITKLLKSKDIETLRSIHELVKDA